MTHCSICKYKDEPGSEDPCVKCKYNGGMEDRFISENEDSCDEDSVIPSIDPVNRPAHYTDGKIEVIEYIEDKGLGFCLGNAIKYISRAGKKYKDKEVEDLKKAIWYIERRIKELEEARE